MAALAQVVVVRREEVARGRGSRHQNVVQSGSRERRLHLNYPRRHRHRRHRSLEM